MKLQVRAEADPAELETTAAEAQPVETRAGARRKERVALDQRLARVRSKDRDLVDRVGGPHHQSREGFQVSEANTLDLRHHLDDAVQRAVPRDEIRS